MEMKHLFLKHVFFLKEHSCPFAKKGSQSTKL